MLFLGIISEVEKDNDVIEDENSAENNYSIRSVSNRIEKGRDEIGTNEKKNLRVAVIKVRR